MSSDQIILALFSVALIGAVVWLVTSGAPKTPPETKPLDDGPDNDGGHW